MRLPNCLLSLPDVARRDRRSAVEITHIISDSRQVTPGALLSPTAAWAPTATATSPTRSRAAPRRSSASSRCADPARPLRPGGGWPGGAGLAERGLVRPPQPRHDAGRHHRHRRQDDHGESALQHPARPGAARADQHRQRGHRRRRPTTPACTPPRPTPPTSSATWPRCATPAPRLPCWRRPRTAWRSTGSPAAPSTSPWSPTSRTSTSIFTAPTKRTAMPRRCCFVAQSGAGRSAKSFDCRGAGLRTAQDRRPQPRRQLVRFPGAIPAERRITYGVEEPQRRSTASAGARERGAFSYCLASDCRQHPPYACRDCLRRPVSPRLSVSPCPLSPRHPARRRLQRLQHPGGRGRGAGAGHRAAAIAAGVRAARRARPDGTNRPRASHSRRSSTSRTRPTRCARRWRPSARWCGRAAG